MVVTRFAPSPTGSLHCGGLRTALYNYIYAKKMGGQFILRIEDTDEVRSTDDSLRGIVRDLKWAGITWDQGPSYNPDDLRNNQIGDKGPYFQSQRKEIYNKFINKLIQSGLAYEKDGAIVFAMPKEDIIVKDQILGDVKFPASQCQDLVIRKSSGMPTFHFAVVIDDASMGVTHIIRGQEHLQNCWKHIALQKALGLPTPVYGHIPLIMNTDGSKMSKRQKSGQVNTIDFRKDGYLASTLLNYLALLGWNPGNDIEHFDVDFMIKTFDIKDVNKGNARFDYKKLENFNSKDIASLPLDKFTKTLLEYGKDFHKEAHSNVIDNHVKSAYITQLYHGRIKTLSEFYTATKFFYDDNVEYNDEIAKKILKTREDIDILVCAGAKITHINNWNLSEIDAVISELASEFNVKVGKIGQPIRFAVTGSNVSPPIDNTLVILGQQKTCKRINDCLAKYGQSVEVEI